MLDDDKAFFPVNQGAVTPPRRPDSVVAVLVPELMGETAG